MSEWRTGRRHYDRVDRLCRCSRWHAIYAALRAVGGAKLIAAYFDLSTVRTRRCTPRVRDLLSSVHEVASARYTAAQVDAWAPDLPNPERWLQRLSDYETFVADDDTGTTFGSTSMTGTGYIDMLFCLPEATRSGVAAECIAPSSASLLSAISGSSPYASLLAQSFSR